MSAAERKITPNDILPMAQYGRDRKAFRAAQVARKASRRLSVGPHATVFFECYDSMWLQVQEMLFIEKGGDEQLVDELAAYNPMVPQGRELTATMMLEVDDPEKRAKFLSGLGGIEDHIFVRFGPHRVRAVAEDDVERTNAAGKTSAVHFLHFPFTDEQVAAFVSGPDQPMFEISHPAYGHIAIMSDAMRAELARDFA